MKIFAFSDWRVQSIGGLIDYVKCLEHKPDVILYGGDDVDRFGSISGDINENKFEELAKYSKYGVFGVIGNDCSKEHKKEQKKILSGKKVFDLHDCPQKIEDYLFIGVEGADEMKIRKHLKKSTKWKKKHKVILVSHCPPYGVLDRGVRFGNGESIGSKTIRTFIGDNNVVLNICGHCHSMGGRSQKLGNCNVINIASHDNIGAKGRIATIEIDEEKTNINISELMLSKLEEIYGIGPSYSKVLEENGITTIQELISQNKEEIFFSTNLPLKLIDRWQIHARSLLNGEAILFNDINLNKPIFVDIETDHTQSHLWMIGIFNPSNKEFKQFTAYEKIEEKKILTEFLNHISKYQDQTLYCYSGTDFDKRVLIDRIKEHHLDESALVNFKDLLYKIRDSLILPISTYKLAELGDFFGFQWKHQDINGFDAPFIYNEYIESKNKEIITKLQEYNRDDVFALQHIINKIKKMQKEKPYTPEQLQKL